MGSTRVSPMHGMPRFFLVLVLVVVVVFSRRIDAQVTIDIRYYASVVDCNNGAAPVQASEFSEDCNDGTFAAVVTGAAPVPAQGFHTDCNSGKLSSGDLLTVESWSGTCRAGTLSTTTSYNLGECQAFSGGALYVTCGGLPVETIVVFVVVGITVLFLCFGICRAAMDKKRSAASNEDVPLQPETEDVQDAENPITRAQTLSVFAGDNADTIFTAEDRTARHLYLTKVLTVLSLEFFLAAAAVEAINSTSDAVETIQSEYILSFILSMAGYVGSLVVATWVKKGTVCGPVMGRVLRVAILGTLYLSYAALIGSRSVVGVGNQATLFEDKSRVKRSFFALHVAMGASLFAPVIPILLYTFMGCIVGRWSGMKPLGCALVGYTVLILGLALVLVQGDVNSKYHAWSFVFPPLLVTWVFYDLRTIQRQFGYGEWLETVFDLHLDVFIMLLVGVLRVIDFIFFENDGCLSGYQRRRQRDGRLGRREKKKARRKSSTRK